MSIRAASKELKKLLGKESVLDRPEDLMVYEYDASLAKGTPDLVVLPQSTEHVVAIVKTANKYKIPIVPRGAGTGLSGGSVPRQGGIVVTFSRMGRILEVDVPNRRAVVQPGVVNTELSARVAKNGLYFAPDPSSQRASTIGGNVAENSGGPHTLAQGVTVNHITGLEVVLPSGEVVEFGGKAADSVGFDLTGFFTGSEGLIGIVTKITVRLTRVAESVATLLAIYNTVDDAANTVTAITSAGITPAALEMLDGVTLRAVEDATHAGFPRDSGAVLLIELEGLREAVEEQAESVKAVCERHQARDVRRAKDDAERALLWKGRKTAFASLGRITPAYYSQDVVVPRTKIPEILRFIEGISKKYNQRIGNIFHAGDGNLHPAIMFDLRDPAQVERTHQAGFDICAQCIKMGGTITGEHGVGMEKQALMSLLFTEDDLDVMKRLHDAFNPEGTMNPQKVFPMTRGCREGVVSTVRPPEVVAEVAG
ncbi:MAG TPA: FAD-linked oxidase C-terminal domain-containing protein [Terriglobales bacterium]|nr:FAD-linked oxidase C-terminal domain-containing protein [Terriglobales bacterium]